MELKIIAELAQGYEGSYKQSKLLIKAAATAGADAVKFQIIYADEMATPTYKYYELFKTLEMSDDEWISLKEYANESDIELHFEVFGDKSLKLAEHTKADSIKLHGTDMNNVSLLNLVAESSVDKVTLGVGGSLRSEIYNALSLLKGKSITLMFGFQGYPTPVHTNQIDRVRAFQHDLPDKFESTDVIIGFADHADPDSPLSFGLPATAIGAGARVIEKHLTLGKVMKMEDHESALNPDEFSEFSNLMKQCFESIGKTADTDDFGMTEHEMDYRKMIRRHVVTRHSISKGHAITENDVVLKRSDSENPITDITSVYGKIADEELSKNMAISPNVLKQ